MLSTERDERPTASAVKERLGAVGLQMFNVASPHCETCHESFPSRNQLSKHCKGTGYAWKKGSAGGRRGKIGSSNDVASGVGDLTADLGIKIRGVAGDAAPAYYFEDSAEREVEASPCIVCLRQFNTKKQFFRHLHGVRHYRGPKYVQKRRAEDGIVAGSEEEHREKRPAQWVGKDMLRHE